MLNSNAAAILVAIIMSLIVVGKLQSHLDIRFDAKALLALVLIPMAITAAVSGSFIATAVGIIILSLISIRKGGVVSNCSVAWAIPLWCALVTLAVKGKLIGLSTDCIANDAILLVTVVLFIVALNKLRKGIESDDAEPRTRSEFIAKAVGVFKANPALSFCTCFGTVAIGVFLIAVFFA